MHSDKTVLVIAGCWVAILAPTLPLVSSGGLAQAVDGTPSYPEHQNLLYYLDRESQKHSVETVADWEIRRRHILAGMQQVMGELPGPAKRVPLDVKPIEEVRVGNLIRRKITYQSDPDDRVSAYLFIPQTAGKKSPAVLCLQQTTTIGKDEPAGLGGDPNLQYALHLAQRGYVTLAPDYPSFGEHAYDFAASRGYQSGTMKAIWDNMRAVDLLQSLPEVDADRIGCIGHSLGGHNTIFTAAFDPRIKVMVSSCGFTRFHKDDMPSWTGPRYMPLIASRFGNSADRVPFDFTEIVGSFAPRPFLACAALRDDDFDVSGVRDVIAAASRVYQLFGKPDNLSAYYPDSGHAFPAGARQVAFEFFDRHLKQPTEFEPVKIPPWVHGVTRMAFITAGELDAASRAGVQVAHANVVWPYFPLRRDGGGLSPDDAKRLREFTDACHARGIKLVLGLPPFPSVDLVKAHPDWRVHSDDSAGILKLAPDEKNLETRIGCNVGPWGDYLIELLVELVDDFKLDGYSFDGNYHPPICFCPHCKSAYYRDTGREIPPRVNLDDVAYRQYLVWRGEQLEQHYSRMQQRLKAINPDAVIMTWTVNAGRYGHFLHSPRAMPTRLNRLLDLPMQEWWLDETNFGGSVIPAFGAAYVGATVGGRPNASEPYLMSRGNPYGTDSFPNHERITRVLLAMTNGSLAPESFGFPGHSDSTLDVFREIASRERWITRTRPMPWAALLVSEQTRQFYAYKDIADRYLPHLLGTFRVAMEEHLPLDLINDWDVNPRDLAKYRVLVLANAAALSDPQVAAIREYVRAGGGLIASADTSLFDELGRPRSDFALADLFGVSYHGRLKARETRPALDSNFAITVDEDYWKQRVGVARITWTDHPLVNDPRLADLVPTKSVVVRGPLVATTEPKDSREVAARMIPEGWTSDPLPAIVVRPYGKGRVVYAAASLDAAMWNYSYPYQRRLLARAMELAADRPFSIHVEAPMCVHTTFFEQTDKAAPSDGVGRRLVTHFFNGINSTGNHGLPAVDVPLREEAVPIHGIRVQFTDRAPSRFHIEPGGLTPTVRRDGETVIVELPPLPVHYMLIGEP